MEVDNKGVAAELLVLAFSYILLCRVVWWHFFQFCSNRIRYISTPNVKTVTRLIWVYPIEKDCLSAVDPFAERYLNHTIINKKSDYTPNVTERCRRLMSAR